MARSTVGVLHPGEMGSAVGKAAGLGGARVLWAPEGRSLKSHARARAAGFEDAADLGLLIGASDVVLSVCPPSAALDVARAVAARAYQGIYVDANAVSPATARAIAGIVEAGGAAFVDGGIVGPPPRARGTTRLYLAGGDAARVGGLFEGSVLEAIVLDGPPGAASALKMAYAAYTKGSAALLMAIRALAVAEGVDRWLVAEWERSQADLPARSDQAARLSAPKAWRFAGEMDEIAATFAGVGLPDGFHRAAGAIYARLLGYKDAPPPSIAEVAVALAGAAGTARLDATPIGPRPG
jgi:3-hydroxyisobutyrate dehydrogenase-like beta-hydroxyacid dehydrogenase